MTLKSMLKAVEEFLSAKERERLRQRNEIKKTLRALKKKERSLASKATSDTSASQARTDDRKRWVVRAQRRAPTRNRAFLKNLRSSQNPRHQPSQLARLMAQARSRSLATSYTQPSSCTRAGHRWPKISTSSPVPAVVQSMSITASASDCCTRCP